MDVNRHYCSFVGGFCRAPDTYCSHWQGTFCEILDDPERSNRDGRSSDAYYTSTGDRYGKNSEVKMAEIVEDIKNNREDPKELVRLMYDLFYNNGGPWYR